MSFNVKHYVAIALGLAVSAAFVLHKPATQEKPVAFQSTPGEFKPLSSFATVDEQPAVVATPLSVTIADCPDGDIQLTTQETEVVSDENEFQFEPENNDFEILAQPEIDQLAQSQSDPTETDQWNDLELMTNDALESPSHTASESVFSQVASQTVAGPTHHYERPNSRWTRNPFADQTASSEGRVTSFETDADETVEPKTPEPSIIVEPPQSDVNDDAMVAEKNSSIDQWSIAEDDKPLEGDFAQIKKPELKMHDHSILSEQPIVPVTPSPQDIKTKPATAVAEIPSFDSLDIAPLQIRISPAIAQQAVHHIEYGKTLARRGASFAARQEFLTAVRVIAQSNDSQMRTNQFSLALAQAVVAMREAEDFVRPNVEAQMVLEVSLITEAHRSNIVSPQEAQTTSPSQALQRYFAFAQQKLDEAGGRNVVTAEAFYCLGKLHSVVATSRSVSNPIDVAKAIAFHQAALLADPQNYRSANELGVLMARQGQLGKATSLFKQSLVAHQTPQTWKNLAVAHSRLGEQQLAQLANKEFKIAAQSQSGKSGTGIQWMPVVRFNETAPLEFNDNTRVASKPKAIGDQTASQTESKGKSFAEKLKDLF